MKKLLILSALLVFACSSDDIDPTIFNTDLDILENLNNGVAPADIVENVGAEVLYGLYYGGGYIFHFDENDGGLIVATDYSQIGNKRWGDIFDLDTM